MEVSSALAAAQRRLFVLRGELNSARVEETAGGWLDGLRLVGETEGETGTEKKTTDGSDFTDKDKEEELTAGAQSLAVVSDVAVGMLKGESAAAGRIWWLLRGMDVAGRGAVETSRAREVLATKGSGWRVCGWRQLRNLLRDGEGVFWERRDGVIWLRSLARVAVSLGVERVQYEAVDVPVGDLLGSIGRVRACFYGAFLSGRGDEAGPIARETLRGVSGVCAESQRQYDERLGVRVTAQFGLLGGDGENAAWVHGRAIFQIDDVRGKFGRAGARVLVRQLPNRFAGVYAVQGRRKRRLNRRISGLLDLGTAGNGFSRFERVFWADGAAAVRGDGMRFVKDGGKWWFAVSPPPSPLPAGGGTRQ